MWPFTKSNKAETVAMSGVATCNGKNHHWSAWKDITVERTVYRPWLPGGATFLVTVQERRCIICNYADRREVQD